MVLDIFASFCYCHVYIGIHKNFMYVYLVLFYFCVGLDDPKIGRILLSTLLRVGNFFRRAGAWEKSLGC